MCNPSQGFYGENNLDDEMTETTITKENIMYQMPPDELLYEWFREAQTSKTEKFTVEMYDDGGYATNAYDVIFRVVEWCNSRKELKPVKITAELTITPEEFEKWCDGTFYQLNGCIINLLRGLFTISLKLLMILVNIRIISTPQLMLME